MRLTDLLIKNLKAPERGQKTYFDDTLRGFGVRVSQGGSKTFVVMVGRDRKLTTLGRYPDTALADARRRAKTVQGAYKPSDPSKAPSLTFSEAVGRFVFDTGLRAKKRTVEEYERLLKRHFAF
ncbi:MAG: DUF4102 domain-containing protein, partial [Rhizobiales bacterium]|nr:DUF4102 domain-containing protein [Hyphomicrobiales bacterium]